MSCKPNYAKIFDENNQKFDENRNILNSIIKIIEKDFIPKWDRNSELILPIDSLDKNTKKTLNHLGIESVEISKNPNSDCEKDYWIVLNVARGWNNYTLLKVQLVYAPCDSKGVKKDRTKSTNYDGLQDFWGQGDGWFIYSDSDAF